MGVTRLASESSRTVTAGAGTTYGAIATWLRERGWALGNLASLPHVLRDARALFERLDPQGRFTNRRLERLGVREIR